MKSQSTGKVDIDGGDGNDTLIGGSNDDKLDGEDGDDVLIGNAGKDKLDGGDGNDTLIGGTGDDKLDGEDGDDSLDGGDGEDDLKGGDGNDTIMGGAGDDKIKGEDGDDSIDGGSGEDDIKAGKGDDTVAGGLGDDELDGDKGFDTAVYAGSVLDFSWVQTGNDKYTVTDLNASDGDEGTDELKKFEALQFSDYTVNLDGTNNAPLIVTEALTTDEDLVLTFAVSAYDFDGDALTLTSFAPTGMGLTQDGAPIALSPAVGTGAQYIFTFDPGSNYQYLAFEEEAFETLTVTVSDGNGGLTTYTADITITGQNDAPVVLVSSFEAVEDDIFVDIELADLVADAEGDALSITDIAQTSGVPVPFTVSPTVIGKTDHVRHACLQLPQRGRNGLVCGGVYRDRSARRINAGGTDGQHQRPQRYPAG